MLTYIYAESNGVSIPSSLSFSTERLTRPLDGLNITNICAILIFDDSPVAGKVVVEERPGVNDTVDIGNNDKKYWIMLAKPEQKCRVFGRCKFWLCSLGMNISSEAGTSTGEISARSE
jgi:hypothetical protein